MLPSNTPRPVACETMHLHPGRSCTPRFRVGPSTTNASAGWVPSCPSAPRAPQFTPPRCKPSFFHQGWPVGWAGTSAARAAAVDPNQPAESTEGPLVPPASHRMEGRGWL